MADENNARMPTATEVERIRVPGGKTVIYQMTMMEPTERPPAALPKITPTPRNAPVAELQPQPVAEARMPTATEVNQLRVPGGKTEVFELTRVDPTTVAKPTTLVPKKQPSAELPDHYKQAMAQPLPKQQAARPRREPVDRIARSGSPVRAAKPAAKSAEKFQVDVVEEDSDSDSEEETLPPQPHSKVRQPQPVVVLEKQDNTEESSEDLPPFPLTPAVKQSLGEKAARAEQPKPGAPERPKGALLAIRPNRGPPPAAAASLPEQIIQRRASAANVANRNSPAAKRASHEPAAADKRQRLTPEQKPEIRRTPQAKPRPAPEQCVYDTLQPLTEAKQLHARQEPVKQKAPSGKLRLEDVHPYVIQLGGQKLKRASNRDRSRTASPVIAHRLGSRSQGATRSTGIVPAGELQIGGQQCPAVPRPRGSSADVRVRHSPGQPQQKHRQSRPSAHRIHDRFAEAAAVPQGYRERSRDRHGGQPVKRVASAMQYHQQPAPQHMARIRSMPEMQDKVPQMTVMENMRGHRDAPPPD